MRSRKQKVKPLMLSLALPPPDTLDEVRVQVQQRSELLINVDDTSVSPMVTTEHPLFPARFFHVDNTNLFVLMDGVSMFTDGKTSHKEETTSHLIGEKLEISTAANVTKKPSCSTMSVAVDSVEAAIRGIEADVNEACPPLTSPVTVFTESRPLSSNGQSAVLATTRGAIAEKKKFFGEGTKLPIADSTSKGGVSLPKDYIAMFTNNVIPSLGALEEVSPKGASAFKVCGFVPRGIVANVRVTVPGDPSRAPDSNATSTTDETSLPCVFLPPTDPAQRGTTKSTGGGKSVCNDSKILGKTFSADDVGRANTSLDLDAVVTSGFIGKGSQGKVHRVLLEDKLYALKCINVSEVIQANNAVEQQGRKRGLVKELNMIRLQRSRKRPEYLMQVFNAVATLDNERQWLHILMELMSFSMDDAQRMVSRISASEMMKVTQSTFRKHLAGSAQVQRQTESLLKQQSASCMHLTGRSSYNTPEEWETNIDRQTPVPEIILSMLAHDVLKGLQELHNDYSIVHCDIKPANVLLDFKKMCFKLADFGCGCQMDAISSKVRRTGIDLGSKLYKAPERLQNELNCVKVEDGLPVVEFTASADVWSLGIMLLELSNGVNPCSSFKSDYWNYVNNLKLSRMVKPLSWSAALHDFVVRCLVRDPDQRCSSSRLLQHPFILRYSGVPRAKLKTFMERLKSESETFQRRHQRELLEEQILLSTGKRAQDTYQNQSRTRWKEFTGFLSVAPQFQDTEKFPQLS